jgi:hypothetical protein
MIGDFSAFLLAGDRVCKQHEVIKRTIDFNVVPHFPGSAIPRAGKQHPNRGRKGRRLAAFV